MTGQADGAELPSDDGMWSHPPGWLLHAVLAGAWVWWLVDVSSPPGVSLGMALVLGAVVAAVWVVWFARLVSFVAARRRGRARGHVGRFLVVPGLCALVTAATVTEAPLRLRWAASQGAFEEVVESARRDDGAAGRSCFDESGETDRLGHPGLFDARDVRTFGSAAVVQVGGDWGFAHLPDGRPDDLAAWEAGCFAWREGEGDLDYDHLSGDWYTWQDVVDLREPGPDTESNQGAPAG